jgi:hypothetical protein
LISIFFSSMVPPWSGASSIVNEEGPEMQTGEGKNIY